MPLHTRRSNAGWSQKLSEMLQNLSTIFTPRLKAMKNPNPKDVYKVESKSLPEIFADVTSNTCLEKGLLHLASFLA